jgi:GxxExxY protein
LEAKLEAIGKAIVEASLRVHTALGPGLLENAYQACLMHDLRNLGFVVQSEVPMPIAYLGQNLDVGYRLDLLIEGLVVVEIKAVERLLPVHQAQLLSYLKLSGLRLGFLLNFNVCHMREGIKRMAN